MPHRTGTTRWGWRDRALCMLLAAVLLFGMLPGLTLSASAEHWADGYLDQLVDWGIMRADQTGDPDAPLTRAEFMAVINRAYGYNQMGPIPFEDVTQDDWFYDDVSIAYTAGYTLGTSATTFHPNATLNREQAVCILARNMMMKETPGENLAFSDARDVSSWARGLIKTAVDHYIVNGYPDGSFGPQDVVSKGQVASMLVGCLGTPLNQPGDYTLGDVYGNVTVTSSGVTLRDTTVSGDLYVSAGVGLGNVKLENVNVLGRIIVSGTGESQGGDASVVLRNVTANEMLVDNMKARLVTLRAEGLTNIGLTTVRTPAYLEDNTPDDFGLRRIEHENAGGRLTLAGRIKEVINNAPGSTVQLSKGTVAKLTVDEAAVGSTVQLDRNTEAKELNLDTGASVDGLGDVDKMNVNASGVTSTMLPDEIYVRPGLEADIAGEVMDTAAAEESSLDPHILSGYPQANDIAPTSLRADFAGNKRGTVYWAVSDIADGSISAADLISPPSYGSRAIKNGSVALPSAETVVPVSITGLTVGGSYYLSAVLVDARDERSPVKVISFTTPDNTKPAFAQGYPYISLVTDTMAQATVMTTKSCKLYYAVLPQNASAPTINELKSAAVTGNLGYGVMDVVKNTEHTFTISRQLEELKDYVAYFWLTDADGANSSSIVSVRFTTKDMTPPEFNPDPDPNAAEEGDTSVKLTAGLNEKGTIFWVAVPRGTPYPNPSPNGRDDNLPLDHSQPAVSARLDTLWAKIQVEFGRGRITKRGQVKVNTPDTEVALDITGLAKEAVYDLYYVAKDDAGNYSKEVKMITIKTKDGTGPVVYQNFSDYQGTDPTEKPTVDSDIILDFSESIAINDSGDLLDLYKNEPARAAAYLRDNFILSRFENTDWVEVVEAATNEEKAKARNWVDYNEVIVRASSTSEGHIEVVFSPKAGGIKMTSGTQYQFELRGVKDLAGNGPKGKTPTTPISILNPKNCENTDHTLKIFDTVFAWVELSPGTDKPIGNEAPLWVKNATKDNSGGQAGDTGNHARVDGYFVMRPKSTANAAADLRYDVIIMAAGDVSYDVYYRIKNASGTVDTDASVAAGYGLSASNASPQKTGNGWIYLGNKGSLMNDQKDWDTMSLGKEFNDAVNNGYFLPLTALREDYQYEFAISVTEKDNGNLPGQWRGSVGFRAYVIASYGQALRTFANGGPTEWASGALQPADIDKFNVGVDSETGRSIGNYLNRDYVSFQADLGGNQLPGFDTGPVFTPTDKTVSVNFTLQNPATVYYVVANRKFSPDDGSPGVLTTNLTINEKATTDNSQYWEDLADVDIEPEENILSPLTNNDETNKLWDAITVQTHKTNPGTLFYSASAPTAASIVTRVGLRDYRYGTMVYSGSGSNPPHVIGGANDPDRNKELTPETDYYIYMVVTDTAGNRSPVYIYNFTTEKTNPPKIKLTDNDENGVVEANTINTSSELIYVLPTANNIYYDESQNGWKNVLNKQLHEVSKKAIPPAYATYKKDKDGNYEKDADGKLIIESSWTVLRALQEDYYYSVAHSIPTGAGVSASDFYYPSEDRSFDEYSVFDIYVDEATRAEVYNKIRLGDKVHTEQDVRTDLNRTNPVENDSRVIFVMGYSSSVTDVDNVDNYSFKAMEVTVYGKAPELTSESSGGGNSNNGGKTFNGSFILRFDGVLYYTPEGGIITDYAPEVHQNCDGSCKKDAVDIIKYVGYDMSGDTRVTNSRENHALTSTLYFSYQNLQPNQRITIPDPGDLSNRNGITSPGKPKASVYITQVNSRWYLKFLWGNREVQSIDITQNVSGGTENAPKLQGFTAVRHGDTETGWYTKASDDVYEYDGQFTLRFDKNLCLAPNMVSDYGTPVPDNEVISRFSKSNNGIGLTTSGTNQGAHTTFTIDFTKMRPGDTLTLPNNYFISTEFGEATEDKVTITLRVDPPQETATLNVYSIYLDCKMGNGTPISQYIGRRQETKPTTRTR